MKIKKRFICKECGYTSVSWIGKCPECLKWNSFVEEIITKDSKTNSGNNNSTLIHIKDIDLNNSLNLITSNEKVNLFFGDGIVRGSVMLITGEPGVGKSTFLLFLTGIIEKNAKILYFSGEESQVQIKKRCERLNINDLNLYISNETEAEKIIEICRKNNPDLIYIDSIQTCFSNSIDSSIGTVSQIKYCASIFFQYAKNSAIPVIFTGHITKSGDIAGPKLLEHIVDVVISFESDFNYFYRLLRINKNRFGSSDEILLFEMKENGLNFIDNPFSFFIDKTDQDNLIGKCKTIIMEGKFPILCEVEALVVPSGFSNSRRFSEGIDNPRLSRISAIIDKHLNEKLSDFDIYFNISGGIKSKDVAIDLAAALAVYSSKNKLKIDNSIIVIGELSLTGKIRRVNRIENRIKEANKNGIKKLFIPNYDNFTDNNAIMLDNISDAIKRVFL